MPHVYLGRTSPLSALFVGLVWAALPALPAHAQEQKPIPFEVLLPDGAVLEIEGYKTTSKGTKRAFETPAVEGGKTYAYTLKATLGDKKISKIVLLKAGSNPVFDLNAEFTDVKPTPMPKAATEEKPLKSKLSKGPSKAGFVTYIEDGRLWIFKEGSKDLTAFLKDGELAKHIIRPGAGPKGMTLKGPDAETVLDYLLAQEGFEAVLEKGGERVWVFKKGSKELAAFKKDGELAKHVIRVKGGPMGMTIKAADAETIDAYMKAYAGK